MDENLNPVYSQIWEVPNGVELQNYTFKNVVFEAVTNPEQRIVNIEKIASKIEINFLFPLQDLELYRQIALSKITKVSQ